MGDARSTHLSWSLGPAESRLVRWLIYVTLAWVLVYALVSVASFLPRLLDGISEFELFTIVLFAGFFLSPILIVLAAISHVRQGRRLGTPYGWQGRELMEEFRPLEFLAAAVLVGLLFSFLGPALTVFRISPLYVPLASLALVYLLSSTGTIDPETMTFSYNEWREADLTDLSAARRFSVGQRTYLWLSFEKGAPRRLFDPGLYTIPTEVADRAWPLFEQAAAGEQCGR